MIRVWFNHWFSTVYKLIDMLREEKEYYIIGTNQLNNAAYKVVCDEWYTEPVLEGEPYAQYCLDFCKEHKIDVFVPRRHMISISKRKNDFEDIGTKVMVDDYDKLVSLNYKSRAYEKLRSIGSVNIPDYYLVTNVNDFKAAYEELLKKYKQVCFKFERDEGGKSFRLIDNSRRGYQALFKKQSTRMPFDDAVNALSETEEFSPMIVMPYLPGSELSIDCLTTSSGRIIIPRVKTAERAEKIIYDEDILRMCNDIIDSYPLECPFNIQFKYLDGIPYFLEINTRMSGGFQLSSVAENINILDIAIKKLFGQNKEWSLSGKDKLVTYIETPLILG